MPTMTNEAGATRPRAAAAISKLLAERIAAGDFPSAVYAVGEAGVVRFTDALGDAVRAPVRHAATLDTIYDLASLTKPLVTGLLCSLFLERGTLELDAPVSTYLPEFARPDKAGLTVRQLLTHTSGLPAWLPLSIITGGEPARALEAIAAQPHAYEPSTRVVYSDLGFITLGFLLQRLAGVSLAELAAREIFAPLNLTRTFFNPARAYQTETAACESEGNAYEREMCETTFAGEAGGNWRTETIWGEVHDGNAFFLGGAAGHAGLFSNVFETHTLAQQFIAASSRLLAPATCALFRSDMTEGLDEARSLAWQLAATPESTAGPRLAPDSFGHLGFTGTSCWIDAERERVFILLTNRTHAHPRPFVNINSTRRAFHTLAVEALEAL
jgi:CubicO group peptidase (beta-lactamase class C family)